MTAPETPTVNVRITPVQVRALRAARKLLADHIQLSELALQRMAEGAEVMLALEPRAAQRELDALLEQVADAQFAARYPETARRMRRPRVSSARQQPGITTPPTTVGGSL